jgi:hypothetical protein
LERRDLLLQHIPPGIVRAQAGERLLGSRNRGLARLPHAPVRFDPLVQAPLEHDDPLAPLGQLGKIFAKFDLQRRQPQAIDLRKAPGPQDRSGIGGLAGCHRARANEDQHAQQRGRACHGRGAAITPWAFSVPIPARHCLLPRAGQRSPTCDAVDLTVGEPRQAISGPAWTLPLDPAARNMRNMPPLGRPFIVASGGGR